MKGSESLYGTIAAEEGRWPDLINRKTRGTIRKESYMRYTLLAILFLGLLIMRPISSYADWHGHDGGGGHGHDGGAHGHDGGWHGHSYVGVNFSVWPDNYYYGGPYYQPADTVLVSSPVYQPVIING